MPHESHWHDHEVYQVTAMNHPGTEHCEHMLCLSVVDPLHMQFPTYTGDYQK